MIVFTFWTLVFTPEYFYWHIVNLHSIFPRNQTTHFSEFLETPIFITQIPNKCLSVVNTIRDGVKNSCQVQKPKIMVNLVVVQYIWRYRKILTSLHLYIMFWSCYYCIWNNIKLDEQRHILSFHVQLFPGEYTSL